MKCPYCNHYLEDEEVYVGYKCPNCEREYKTKELVEYIMKGANDDYSYETRTGKTIPVVTMDHLPGYDVEKVLGPAYGLTARSRGVGGRIEASFETIFGGEITAFVSECRKARAESVSRLIDHAIHMGANAVLKVDFETSTLMRDIMIFSTYGTAVIVKPA